MPTALILNGFKFFFYSNEGNEPPHVHVRRQGCEAKFWLQGPEEVKNYGFSLGDMTEIKSMIVEHRQTLGRAWRQHFGN